MLLRVSAVVLAVGLLSGCALFDSGPKPVASTYVTLSDSSAGYALLYETVSKQKRTNLLSYIKKETPELKALLERIAETSRATADELEALAKGTPPLNLTATLDILRAIAKGEGPANAVLALGYAGWSAGQLETEIQANGWLNCPADPNIVFHSALDSKYDLALRRIGIDPAMLSTESGRA